MSKNYSYVGICTEGYIYYLSITSDRTLVQQMEDLFVVNDYQISEEEYDTETEEIKSEVIINKVGAQIIQIRKARKGIKKPSRIEVRYTNNEVELMSRRQFKARFDAYLGLGVHKEGSDLYDTFCIQEIVSLKSEKIVKVPVIREPVIKVPKVKIVKPVKIKFVKPKKEKQLIYTHIHTQVDGVQRFITITRINRKSIYLGTFCSKEEAMVEGMKLREQKIENAK